jgi:hypothetical protein
MTMLRNPEHEALSTEPQQRGRQQGRKLSQDSRRGKRGKVIAGTAAATAVAAFGPGLANELGEAAGNHLFSPDKTIADELSDYGTTAEQTREDAERSLSEGGSIDLPHPTEANQTVRISLPNTEK